MSASRNTQVESKIQQGSNVPTLREFFGCRSDASALEFAICCPLLASLLLGIFSYGTYIGAAHSVSQLAADAARASLAGIDDNERQSIALEHVTRNASSYPLLAPSKLKVSASAGQNDQTSIRISVVFDATDLPMWFVYLPAASPTIERAAVISVGGT